MYLSMIESPEDRSKFERIYLHYRGLMYHVAYQILNNEADAEDAVHSAFMKIAERIEKIDEPVCPKTQSYIVTIVENKAIDMYRSNRRRGTSGYFDEAIGQMSEDEPLGLDDCILRLPHRYREIIILKYAHGLTNRELAKQLGITEANAIKLDQRAKNKLRKLCKEAGIL